MQLTITKADRLKAKPDVSNPLAFGTIFTDHMFNMDYHPDKGWYNPRIEPYAPIQMDPATMVLHYGQAVFEGLKAYRTGSGAIQLFRPRDNYKRLNRSSHLLCIPEIDEAFGVEALKELIRLEKDWVPGAPGTSLYIRPTIIATDPFLGVRASHTYRFFVILSPVGAYYSAGFNPVKIWVTRNHVRAVRGGVGEAKTPGNYAASLFAADVAHKKGYTQVLWLDGVEQKYIEEVGAMNIFFVIDGEIITPALKRQHPAGHHPEFRSGAVQILGAQNNRAPDQHRRSDGRPCFRKIAGDFRFRHGRRHFTRRRTQIRRAGHFDRRWNGRADRQQAV